MLKKRQLVPRRRSPEHRRFEAHTKTRQRHGVRLSPLPLWHGKKRQTVFIAPYRAGSSTSSYSRQYSQTFEISNPGIRVSASQRSISHQTANQTAQTAGYFWRRKDCQLAVLLFAAVVVVFLPATKNGTVAPLTGTGSVMLLENAPVGFRRKTTKPALAEAETQVSVTLT